MRPHRGSPHSDAGRPAGRSPGGAVRPCGERALLVEIDGHGAVHRLAALTREHLGACAEEIVPGHRTVLVVGREQMPDAGRLGALAERAAAEAGAADGEPTGALVEIEVRYDGADIGEVASLTGLSAEEVVRRHSAATYLVAFLGFAPGFAYLVGGDPLLAVPRREEPRSRVPAGSVAIAGPYSAVYPTASPGGWRLLGTTDRVLFNPASGRPALLTAGARVRFTELR